MFWFLLLSNLYVSSAKWQPTFDEFRIGAVLDVWVCVYLCVVCRLCVCVQNYCYTTRTMLATCTSKEEVAM